MHQTTFSQKTLAYWALTAFGGPAKLFEFR